MEDKEALAYNQGNSLALCGILHALIVALPDELRSGVLSNIKNMVLDVKPGAINTSDIDTIRKGYSTMIHNILHDVNLTLREHI